MGSLNPAYASSDIVEGIRAHFREAEFPSVSLQKCVTAPALKKIAAGCAGTKKDIAPLSHSYASKKASAAVVKTLFADDVRALISSVVGRNVAPKDVRIIQLRSGSYALRRPSKGLQFVFCIEEWDERCGGEVVFADDDGNAYTLPTTANTLSIARSSIDRFIRYVNHRAGKKTLTYVIGRLV